MATAQTAGPAALAIAVVVKLTRVILLAPMTAAAGLEHRFSARRKKSAGAAMGADSPMGRLPPVVPLFVVGFAAMAAVRSLGWADHALLEAAGGVQDVLLAAALCGLGSAVRVGSLLDTGGRAWLVALASWILIAALGLGAAWLMVR